jgi:hypothetical protein
VPAVTHIFRVSSNVMPVDRTGYPWLPNDPADGERIDAALEPDDGGTRWEAFLVTGSSLVYAEDEVRDTCRFPKGFRQGFLKRIPPPLGRGRGFSSTRS